MLMAAFGLWSVPSQALTAQWLLDANGNWTVGGNWSGGIAPNGIGDIASFNLNLTANRTISLDAPITLGGLILGDTLGAQTLTFAAPGPLTLDATGTAHAFINKYNSTTDTWQTPSH